MNATNFDRKSKISTTGLPLAATSPTLALSAPAHFASLLPTLGPSAQALAYTLIYLMQPLGISTTSGAYMLPPSTGFPPLVYTLPGIRRSPVVYIQLSSTILVVYSMQFLGIEPIPGVNIQPLSTGFVFAAHLPLGIRPTSPVYI